MVVVFSLSGQHLCIAVGVAAFLVEGRGSGRGDSVGDWRFRVVGDLHRVAEGIPVPDAVRGLEKIDS